MYGKGLLDFRLGQDITPQELKQLTLNPALPTLRVMEVQLTPDQQAFARQAVEAGRVSREEEVVGEALAMWEKRERTRSEILAAVDGAEASIARGEDRVITEESMVKLAEEVKRRGRERFVAERTSLR
jgi:Arc/MetJ-type ribon-helix-helix transcriptional regulator